MFKISLFSLRVLIFALILFTVIYLFASITSSQKDRPSQDIVNNSQTIYIP